MIPTLRGLGKIVLVGLAVSVSSANPGASGAGAGAAAPGSRIETPLRFEAVHGPADADVRFLARGSGYALLLTRTEAVLALRRQTSGPEVGGRVAPGVSRPGPVATDMVQMRLVGANPAAEVVGTEPAMARSHYYIRRDPDGWRTNVQAYAKVRYSEVYPGIDLIYYGREGRLEYDFVVAPGADPRAILLEFDGTDRLEIDGAGDLIVATSGGTLRLLRPSVYQEQDGVRRPITSSYRLVQGAAPAAARRRVAIDVAERDLSRPLVIDPVIVYSTYLGGSGSDHGSAIAVDPEGNVYVTGTTFSSDFPTQSAFQPNFAGGDAIFQWGDAFVAKFDASGALLYSTYLGGSTAQDARGVAGTGAERGEGIAVDPTGNAYITGWTDSSDFPTLGAIQSACVPHGRASWICSGDVYVAKLDAIGQLMYATYLGGDYHDSGYGIAVDADGNAYVAGETQSWNFPVTPSAFDTTLNSGSDTIYSDGFVAKLNPEGSGLVYATYLGGTNPDHERATAIAVDAAGSAYVTGFTSAANFPTTASAFQLLSGSPPGGWDAFVTKLHPDGSAPVYSTYLGGNSTDFGMGIAVNAAGEAHVAGGTISTDFPVANAFQPTFRGGFDAFVTKLNTPGSAPVYSTYLGGAGSDGFNATRIAIGPADNAYVTGATGSANFPLKNAFQTSLSYIDAFVAAFAPGGGLLGSSYLGGGDLDGTNGNGAAVAVDTLGNVWVTGNTASADFPVTPGAFQTTFGGRPPGSSYGDAYVTKIAFPTTADVTVTKTDSPDPVFQRGQLTYTVTVANLGPADASGIVLTDTLPEHVGFVDLFSSQGDCGRRPRRGVVSCDLGDLTAGASATVTIVIKPRRVGTIANTVSVTAAEPDPDPVNNAATQETTVLSLR